VPHALRRLFGPDVRVLLPASLLGGGAALVVCDLASRLLFRWLHTEPPVGAVTALVGGPVFLLLLRRERF
jgi:iron complex transport system permease protein